MDTSATTSNSGVMGAGIARSHQPLTPLAPSSQAGAIAGSASEVRATLAGFEGLYALLNLAESNELIRWPKSKIPVEAKIGDNLLLEAVSLSRLKEEELTRMRKLLEELIN